MARTIRIAAAAAWVISLAALAPAGPPATYYSTANPANGPALKASLNSIVTAGHAAVGYSNAEASLYVTDQDPANSANVIMIYTDGTSVGYSRPKSGAGGNNSVPSTGGWNKEHSYPQSTFNQDEPQRSDLHALFPCDADINTRRSNDPYDTVTTPAYTDLYGNRSDNTQFEPPPADRGRVARALFYMDTRYEGAGGTVNLRLVNTYPAGTGSGETGNLNYLLNAHRTQKPSAFERNRNARTFNRQGNTNPFIDHPEWAAPIFGGTAYAVANGDVPTVTSTNRAPAATQAPNAQNIPALGLNFALPANEWHLKTLAVAQVGTILDSEITAVRLWWDVDGNGVANSVDTLLDTRTFSGGAATFDLTGNPFFIAQSTYPASAPELTRLLVTVSLAGSLGGARTVQIQATGNGMQPDAAGGTDTAPTFATQSSNVFNAGSGVSNGDTLTVASAALAPANVVAGTNDVAAVRLTVTPSGNEWDLGSLSISEIGTSLDSDITAVKLFFDGGTVADSIDAGDTLLATGSLSGGAATLTPSPAFRLAGATARRLIVAYSVSNSAVADRTVNIQVNANGLASATSGGTDVNPTFGAVAGGPSIIRVTQGGNAGSAPIVISEVFEGAAVNLKYVELYNTTTGTINLASPKQYALRRYNNGSLTPSATITLASFNLAPGAYYVLANNPTDFDPVFGAAQRNVTNSAISFNGDDCWELWNATDSVAVDGFGTDILGTTINFALNVNALRKLDELPNSGGWGGAVQPTANEDSPSGFWATRTVTTGNANAAAIGNPGNPGVPVAFSAFGIE